MQISLNELYYSPHTIIFLKIFNQILQLLSSCKMEKTENYSQEDFQQVSSQ